jgi:hypothetical protein
VFGQPSGPQHRMQRTKLEIPFAHAFDSHGLSSSKSAVCVSPSPVIVLTPTFGEAAITSWPPRRRMATPFEPIRPEPPITTISIANSPSSVAGRWSSLGCATRRDARFSGSVREETKKEKFPDRAPPGSGISERLAQNGVCDRDNHVRKSRSQCTDPDAAHSRDDRGRDNGAHRDAKPPKAIGITLIDTVRDQHGSQP